MNKELKFFASPFTYYLLLVTYYLPTAFAATFSVPIETSGPGGKQPTSYVDIGKLVANLYTTLVIITGIYTFINLALAGFQYVSSSGDKLALENARNKITHSLLGLTIVVAAYAVAAIAKPLFGVSLIGPIAWPKP